MTADDQKRVYEELAAKWQLFTPPARPSEGTMALYEKHLVDEGAYQTGHWGVLGCTPEIRSLGGKYQRPVTCIDKNPAAYPAMGFLCRPSKSETFVNDDWLSADLPEQFDLIMGDGSMAMLPPDQHEPLLQNIHRMLKPQGVAVLRVHISDGLAYKTPGEVFAWYRATCPEMPVYKATKTFLSLLWLDPVTCLTPPQVLRDKIDELYQQGVITAKEYDGYQFHRNNYTEVHYTRQAVFGEKYAPYFLTGQVSYAGDYPSHLHHPVYVLRKK